MVNFFLTDKNEKEYYEEFNKKVLEERRIVYVNNPSLDIKNERRLKLNKKYRVSSRKKILDYFKSNSEEPYQPQIRKWLDKNYPLENERIKTTVLDISKRELRGRLNLKGFTNLKRLNCSDNQLTSLDLSDCPNLVELKCNNNQFTNLNFLKSVNNLEKLEIQDNQNLSSQSLLSLQNLNKLEELNINNTNLSEGWEYLLKNCSKIYCNSEEIIKELEKKNCSDNDNEGKEYYNLATWRATDKQNNLTATVIPLERLFVIRSSIKKFVNKWGIKKDNEKILS